MAQQLRSFTKEEFSRYNGGNGAPAFVAFRGLVYDVTGSFLWQHGKHQVTHFAGYDYANSLQGAPHGEDLLQRFPVVGRMVDE
jgi:predicted heme/steroid binding protein